jgi:hypothetical protein
MKQSNVSAAGLCSGACHVRFPASVLDVHATADIATVLFCERFIPKALVLNNTTFSLAVLCLTQG